MTTGSLDRKVRTAFGARPAVTSQPDIQTQTYRSLPMTTIANTSANSGGWITFTYAQFAAAIGMAALGVFFLPVDLQVKGYMLMSNVFLIGATFTLAKTVRDEHENKKMVSRIEDARTEKLLMEVGR
jgi:hypothetical protein